MVSPDYFPHLLNFGSMLRPTVQLQHLWNLRECCFQFTDSLMLIEGLIYEKMSVTIATYIWISRLHFPLRTAWHNELSLNKGLDRFTLLLASVSVENNLFLLKSLYS